MAKANVFRPLDEKTQIFDAYFCINGVHVEQWNDYGHDHHYGGSAGFKILGACDESCKPTRELPSEVMEIVNRFKKDGQLGRFILSEHSDDAGYGNNPAPEVEE